MNDSTNFRPTGPQPAPETAPENGGPPQLFALPFSVTEPQRLARGVSELQPFFEIAHSKVRKIEEYHLHKAHETRKGRE